AFRETCREKILALARSGRTIIMVSHDAELVRTICDRVVLLERGQVKAVARPAFRLGKTCRTPGVDPFAATSYCTPPCEPRVARIRSAALRGATPQEKIYVRAFPGRHHCQEAACRAALVPEPGRSRDAEDLRSRYRRHLLRRTPFHAAARP